VSETQHAVDEQNRAFWDELCGTNLAQAIGVTEINPDSLARYDGAYMAFYPYLERYLDALPVEGRETLEIGLGFGTVGQILAARGARYHGADISPGPVAMMRDRLRWLGVEAPDASVVQASALDLPWEAETFDFVVSIGCLHHTGDLPRAVDEVHRVLRPRGTALVMLYNARSYRQLRVNLARARQDARLRAMYDANTAGEAAPHTDFVSRRDVKRLFSSFSSVRVESQNFDPLAPSFRGRTFRIPRERLLGNVARSLGLDLYVHAHK
jgi:SAM-dependent methyltransferase